MRKLSYFLKNYFLPTERNNNFPYALRLESLSFVVLLALIIKSLSFASWLVLPRLPFFADISSGLIIQLTNEERLRAGVSPVVPSPVLTRVAQEKAQDMISKGYFSHNSPDGLSPWYWFKKNNYLYQYAGENLAMDFFESRDVVEAWMNSPTHRFNLLNQNYQEIGVAVVSGQLQGRQTTLVVQVFGTPKTKLSQAVTQPSSTSLPSLSPKPVISPKPVFSPKPSFAPSPVPSPLPSLTPAVAGAEIFPSPVSSPSPSLVPSLTPSPSPSSSTEPILASPAPIFSSLSVSPLTEALLNLTINPKPILFGLIGYLGIVLLLGVFSKIYTPYPKAILGTALAIVIILIITYLPGAEQTFYLTAKILAATS